MKALKKDLKKLIELIEHNTTNLWLDNLETTSDCIILENINSKDMRSEEDIENYMDDDYVQNQCMDNYQFSGDELYELIKKIKKQL